MGGTLPGSSVYGISQAGILEWVAIFFSRGSSWPRDRTCIFCIASGFFYHWVTREALRMFKMSQLQLDYKYWVQTLLWRETDCLMYVLSTEGPTGTGCTAHGTPWCASLDGRGVLGRTGTCVSTAESLHCSPEIITTLFVNQLYPITK